MQERRENPDEARSMTRRERCQELRTKYASQLAELESAGIQTDRPGICRQLEKHEGDVSKVRGEEMCDSGSIASAQILEKMKIRTERKARKAELNQKYSNELAQCEAQGVQMKNQRVLLRLLEKANGDVNQVKQLVEERQEKHRQRKEYRRKHHHDDASPEKKKRRELSTDEMENLKRLRAAGVHGNPHRILAIFHECNESIEMTIARKEEQREQRTLQRDERTKVMGGRSFEGDVVHVAIDLQKRALLKDVQNAYIALNQREDWPANIEQVYLDGNNMMFVVDSLRRLCLNRAGKKTERALGEIAAAWNEQLRIPHVDLVFDSTKQVGQIGSVMVSSAQPQHRTTDDMLIELARRPENREKNNRTIIVTSDRALATLVRSKIGKRETFVFISL